MKNCFLGAIVGDVVGSVYEWHNIKTKDFPLFSDKCFLTDDSIMTLAIGLALVKGNGDLKTLGETTVKTMQKIGLKYPHAGYGGRFARWLMSRKPEPYNSLGNGSAMRVSAVAYAANSLADAIRKSRIVTEVTHNHPEGLKGAEATVVATYMALHGSSKEEIMREIHDNYYPMNFKLDELRPVYNYDVTCMGTVPPALKAFFESDSFEDAIRNAISLGGDSDTLAAITGAVAGAFYGVPEEISDKVMSYMDNLQKALYVAFNEIYGV